MKIAAFDIETNGLSGKFRSAAIWDDEGGRFYEDQTNFIEALRTQALRGCTLFAHNAEYDIIHGLWEGGEDVTMHFYDQTFNRGAWRYGNGKRICEIWDSLNLGAGLSLASIGTAIGKPKYETPSVLRGKETDRYKWICDKHSIGECIECYNIRDAEIVYTFISEFASWLEGMGLVLKRTLGSVAVQLWRFFDPGKQQLLKGKLITDMARLAYHGGRCENFMVGQINGIYTYDTRRHYAAVMLNSPMPDCRGLTYVENPKSVILDDIEGVIDVTVNVPNMHIPPLPIKAVDGSVYYGVGRMRGCWMIAEMRKAIMMGVIIEKCHRIAYTRHRIKPFEITAIALTELRNSMEKRGDPRAFLAKIALYSIYGRLGVRDEQEYRTYARKSRFLTEQDIAGKSIHWIGDLRYIIASYRVKMRSKIQNVLWAAQITACGRLSLLEHLLATGQNLVYCDTDSVFSLVPISGIGEGPGELRDTGHFQLGYIYGPKLYRLEQGDTPDKAIARGIPRQLVIEFLEHGTVSVSQPVSVLQAVASHKPVGSWETFTKRHRSTITRRHINDVWAMRGKIGYSTTSPVTFYMEPGESQFLHLPFNRNPNRFGAESPVATGLSGKGYAKLPGESTQGQYSRFDPAPQGIHFPEGPQSG